jgi:antitoxin component YwqK of YwqJK toxin-antitoxin module
MTRILSYSHFFCTFLATSATIWAGSLVMFAASAPKRVEREYHANGMLASEKEFNAKGELHGLMRVWSETGILGGEWKYVHGEWVMARSYYPSGKLMTETTEGANYMPIQRRYPE